MSPRIRLASLAVSAVVGFSVLAAAPAGATESDVSAPAVCQLSDAGVKAALDELALIKAQLKGTKPSKAERAALLAALKELNSAVRGGESNRSRKRKGDLRKALAAKLGREKDPEVRAILRAQLSAVNEALEPGRLSKAEKDALKAKRAELVALLTGKPNRAAKKALQLRKVQLNRLLEPCLPAADAPVEPAPAPAPEPAPEPAPVTEPAP